MKLFFIFFGLFLINQSQAGVGQGNPAKYVSNKYNFGFKFDQNLTIREINSEHVIVDNQNLIRPNQKKSSFATKVISLQNAKQSLNLYLRQKFKGKSFIANKINQLDTYTFTRFSSNSVLRIDYLITGKNTVIEAKTTAYRDGNGIKQFLPIVNTIHTDIRGPQVTNVKIPASIEAGSEKAKIFFQATDFESGIAEHLDVCANIQSSGGNHWNAKISICGKIKALGNHWYEVVSKAQVSQWLKPGKYFLEHMEVKDKARNKTQLSGFDGKQKFLANSNGPKIPTPTTLIVNKNGGDVTAPKIKSLRLPKTVISGKDKLTIFFEATEKESGLAKSLTSCATLRQKGKSTLSAHISVCGPVRSLRNDWYAVTSKTVLNQWLPQAEYDLTSFSISDRVGNWTRLWSFKDKYKYYHNHDSLTQIPIVSTRLSNNGIEDKKAPIITDIKLPTSIRAGKERAKIYFRALDDISGIKLTIGRAEIYPSSTGQGNGSILLSGKIMPLPNNWYMISSKVVNKRLPKGEYLLRELIVYDNAGNGNWIRIIDRNKDTYKSSEGQDIPLAKTKIIK